MKLYALLWHYIESDGLSGVFASREEAEAHLPQSAGKDGFATIHEIDLDAFYPNELPAAQAWHPPRTPLIH